MNYNAYVFLLKLKDRPKKYPKINLIGKYWHTGIIYRNKVYETFSNNKFNISNFNNKQFLNAEFYLIKIKDPKKLRKFIELGLPCDNFVNKVLNYKLTKEKNIVRVNFK
jgi:hypothetical protein